MPVTLVLYMRYISYMGQFWSFYVFNISTCI